MSERSYRLARKLIENFAWNRFKMPVCVQASHPSIERQSATDAQRKCPASFHVIDGQHTAIVAATLNIAKIPIFIVVADTVDERARAFVSHNRDRTAVSSFDIYRALLASGDPDAVDVDNVCKRAGVRLRVLSQSSAAAEGDTAAIGLVRALVKRRGVMKARQILECLVKAKRAPIGQAEILAVANLITDCELAKKKIDFEALAVAVRLEGNDGIAKALARAKTEKMPVWRALMERYERRLGKAAA